MVKMTKNFILLTAFILSCFTAYGNDKAVRAKFDKGTWRYQTSLSLFQKDEINVTIISAVHIGTKKYFADLNSSFKNYDVVLFESLSGYQAAIKEQGIKSSWDILAAKLKLHSQLRLIDYKAVNFVHADLSLKALLKFEGVEKEDVLDMQKLKKINLSFELADPEILKRFYRNIFSQKGLKNELIIKARNAHCMKILNTQLKRHKNIAIFYGAAHFQDMKMRLQKSGFKEISKKWITVYTETSK